MNSQLAAGPEVFSTIGRMSAVRRTEVELYLLAGYDGYLREVNDAFGQLLGLEPAEVGDRSLLELVHPDDLTGVVAALAALEAGTQEVQVENRFARGGGGWIHLQWIARPVPDTDLWWAAGRDTTEFHRLVTERSDLQTRLELFLGQSTAAMWDWNLRSGSITWEPHASEVLGVALEAVPTRAAELVALVDVADRPAVANALEQLRTTGVVDLVMRVVADGVVRHLSLRGKVLDRDRRARPARAVGLVLDVTTEKAVEERTFRMIMNDALTGVPNRRAFDQALRGEWRRCSQEGLPVSVAMIDIDDFKRLNDTFGHLFGDQVLCEVARALRDELHARDGLLARFGGEEFAVVLPGVGRGAAVATAQRLLEAVRALTLRQSPEWKLSVSIGTASWEPGDEQVTSFEALAQADRALYAAKTAGKDQVVAHREDLTTR